MSSIDFTSFLKLMAHQKASDLFITAGIDDALNRTIRDGDLLSPNAQDLASRRVISGRDIFIGGGFYFTDDDLKALISVIPSP